MEKEGTPKMAKPKVICVSNQKSGVGKSTTVFNLGAGLALDAKKVLLLGVDPQGDLTKMLGQRKLHNRRLTLCIVINKIVVATQGTLSLDIVRQLKLINLNAAYTYFGGVQMPFVHLQEYHKFVFEYLAY